jgi:AcrR family transcriptional regulator
MGRRGGELRDHILKAAKDVFLEVGYERASMDVVAARAETSKRSLYAHFESKEKLFAAVVDYIRELYLVRLGTPADYGDDPAAAVTRYCGRFLQLVLWQPALRTFRLNAAEAERLPESSAQYYDAIFTTTHARLATYLDEQYDLGPRTGDDLARELLGHTVYPQLFRALFGVDAPVTTYPDESALDAAVDLAPIRVAVDALLPSN